MDPKQSLSSGGLFIDDEDEEDQWTEEEPDDDSSDCSSCSSSLIDDEHEVANSAEDFLSMCSHQGVRKILSSPSLVHHELSATQVDILFKQSKRRESLSGKSLNCSGKLLHIQGEAMELKKGMENRGQEIKEPTTVFKEILVEAGYTPRVFAYNEISGFFLDVTESRTSSYTSEIITAVKINSIEYLRQLQKQTGTKALNSCNRFGDSILHIACRQGLMESVKFLLLEAKVDPRVCDDFGRTPCHDAAWQAEPNMELISLIVTACPDLLLVADKRGYTPLQYVRRSHWATWNTMLEEKRRELLPTQLF